MKIISLTAENLKKLVAVHIEPKGNMVQITGANGSGKTSVLDAIWWALTGQANVQSVPIRRGAERAVIKLDLGELIVTRTFNMPKQKEGEPERADKGPTTSLKVTSADGKSTLNSPQKVLDELLGEIAMDPLEFARAKPEQQFHMLRRFVPGVDFAAIDAANKADYDKRREHNREAKGAREAAARIVLPDPLPERLDTATLAQELEAAGQHNREIDQRSARRQAAESEAAAHRRDHSALVDRISTLRNEIDVLERQANDHLTAANEIDQKLADAPPLPEPIDTAPIRAKMASADAVSLLHQQADRKRDLEAEAEAQEKAAAKLTNAMELREFQKNEAIAAVKLPVDGIGFGDQAVTLDDLPFDQASDAQQLRASIAIAMASNPKLRVIRVRDGSLLDENAMRLLAEMADANDCQVWIERVDTSGEVGFVLEDGHLRETPK